MEWLLFTSALCLLMLFLLLLKTIVVLLVILVWFVILMVFYPFIWLYFGFRYKDWKFTMFQDLKEIWKARDF